MPGAKLKGPVAPQPHAEHLPDRDTGLEMN